MTTKQVQCLLAFLGYYAGEIDGIAGPMTIAALKSFQADYGNMDVDGFAGVLTQKALRHAVTYGMPEASKQPAEDYWDSIKHFKRDEMKCKCGGKYCNGFPVEPSKKLMRLADRVREHFNAPAIISSGVRCDVHNNKVGGVPNSRHKIGTAMDFRIKDLPASVVLPYVQSLSDTHYAYAIDGSYVHMDVIE